MNMIIRILLLPLTLFFVTVAGLLATTLAAISCFIKAFNNDPFSKVKVQNEDLSSNTAPSVVKH